MTSKKHWDFTSESMERKSVKDVPGIKDVIGGNLERAGIKTAKQLYGRYLTNPAKFKDFMMHHGADRGQQRAAYNAMKGWEEQHN